ncbi:hypothetical protein LINPERHAP2_LOCUS24198 [Linum perenne]
MDKSWIHMPRNTQEYVDGVEKFLDFAFAHTRPGVQTIPCPCTKCRCNKRLNRDMVLEHLLRRSFPVKYQFWNIHGEKLNDGDSSSYHTTMLNTAIATSTEDISSVHDDHVEEMQNLLHDAFGVVREDQFEGGVTSEMMNENEAVGEQPSGSNTESTEPQHSEFVRLMKDGEKELYPGCKTFSKLSFTLRLYHIKYMYKISEKAMSNILELLREAFDFADIPKSVYEAKKTVKALGMSYKKIDACRNDCMLYWGDTIDDQSCAVCKESRFKTPKPIIQGNSSVTQQRKPQPNKVFRYFPLIPRLKRLFMTSKSVNDMIWHSTEQTTDDILRHPRDSKSWKHFDLLYPEFASEPRNVRLGLASDGFNPFGTMSTNHSTWPILLFPYNTAPWNCMKQTSIILSSIIPGDKQPGNDIDVYLAPLIDELRTLWEGVEAYDTSKKETFKLRAALMWTISDFPGLEILSGWNTKTGKSCPTCNFDTVPLRLPSSGKNAFMGSRRFLPINHRFRQQRRRFDGKVEERGPPLLLTGSEVLKQLENVNVTFGKIEDPKTGKKRYRDMSDKTVKQWKKKSIFFELPYWEFILLRHNLDVMHIEKNVCDNILFTLLNDKDKRKDHLAARKDLVALNIKKELWPDENDRCPAALFTLAKQEIDTLLQTLKSLSFPEGYASNISRCVHLDQRRMFGMKTHDAHILLHEVLPVAVRNVLPKQVAAVVVEFSSCIKALCARVVNNNDLDAIQDRLVMAVCHMEMIFPPSFFTVMVHLVLHFVEEVRLGGPVQYRWMYPIERFLGKLKGFVGNRAQPEGSIAEGWINDEICTFSSMYLDDTVESRFNREKRVHDPDEDQTNHSSDIFPVVGKTVGKGTPYKMREEELLQAHRHVLFNIESVEPFIE